MEQSTSVKRAQISLKFIYWMEMFEYFFADFVWLGGFRFISFRQFVEIFFLISSKQRKIEIHWEFDTIWIPNEHKYMHMDSQYQPSQAKSSQFIR